MKKSGSQKKRAICIVSPFPPPYGGMSIQAQKLSGLIRRSGFAVLTVKTNADWPRGILFLSRLKGIRYIFNLVFFFKSLHKVLPKIDVVYFLTGFFHFFFLITYPALLLIKIRRKRIVLSAHGGGAEAFFKKYALLVRPILKRVDVVTTPSAFLRDVFKKCLKIDTKVVPNIADLDQFGFRARYPVRPRLLVTRSLEVIYDVGCVIRAFKIVQGRFPDSRLGIVGDGTERQKLEQMVSDLGLVGSVKFYGRVPNRVIQQIYADYDVFVNASTVDNAPLTILEAFACGLPVVTTRAGGIPYMVQDGITGFLVAIGDADSLAAKVIALLEDPDLAVKISRNAREECLKYSWHYVKGLLLPILER